MKFDPKYIRWAMLAAGLVTTLATAIDAYVSSTDQVTSMGLLLAAGTALMAWAAKAPGTLTKGEADELAEQRAKDRVTAYRISSVPPAAADEP